MMKISPNLQLSLNALMTLWLTKAPERQSRGLSPVRMRTFTPAGGLLHTGSASTSLRTLFPPQPFPWRFCAKTEKKGNGTTICRKNFNNLVFGPGGRSCCLWGYLFLGDRRALLQERVHLGRRDGIRGWTVFSRTEDYIILFQEGQAIRRTL